MTDQCLAIGGMRDQPLRFRNSPFQLLDCARDLARLFLAVEAVHLDTAVVGHHLLEAQMRERGEMQQLADREIDADPIVSRRHLLFAGGISLAPAGRANGVAEDPEPALIPLDTLLVAR